jgi:hypothetical protein
VTVLVFEQNAARGPLEIGSAQFRFLTPSNLDGGKS